MRVVRYRDEQIFFRTTFVLNKNQSNNSHVQFEAKPNAEKAHKSAERERKMPRQNFVQQNSRSHSRQDCEGLDFYLGLTVGTTRIRPIKRLRQYLGRLGPYEGGFWGAHFLQQTQLLSIVVVIIARCLSFSRRNYLPHKGNSTVFFSPLCACVEPVWRRTTLRSTANYHSTMLR